MRNFMVEFLSLGVEMIITFLFIIFNPLNSLKFSVKGYRKPLTRNVTLLTYFLMLNF